MSSGRRPGVRGDDPPRHADDHRVGRNVFDHNGVRADLGSAPMVIGPEDAGARAHGDAVLERRVALDPFHRSAAERDAVIEHHVVADLGRLADHDAHRVVDEEPPADRRARVDLDAGEQAGSTAEQQPGRQRSAVPLPHPVRQPVQPDRVQAGIDRAVSRGRRARPGPRAARVPRSSRSRSRQHRGSSGQSSRSANRTCRDVALAEARDDHDDQLAVVLRPLADFDRGRRSRPRRRARRACPPRRRPGGPTDGGLGVDVDDLVVDRAVEDLRDEVRADALDLVRAGLAAVEDRRLGRLDGDDLAPRACAP